ncbi:MAG: hypothetical protein GY932_14575 [Arcobacter sp.]|nr:hypothetical protein [Arcobacter sp.]
MPTKNIKKIEVNENNIEEVLIEFKSDFEKRYIKASKSFYSKNIASFDDMVKAQSFVKKNKIEDNTILVISNSNKVMVMHGIYKNRDEALNSIEELSDTIKRNNPFIQKIFRTQESFKKNNLKFKIKNTSKSELTL